MKKWKKRLLIALTILLVGCFALPVIDRIWFVMSVPSEYADARWRLEE